MKEVPKEITLCNLEVIVMPNKEILCNGRRVGWFQEFGQYLTKKEGKK
jgi:hypothetical protein